MLEIYVENVHILNVTCRVKGSQVKELCCKNTGLNEETFFLLHNGKLVYDKDVLQSGNVHVVLRLLGGKGGFGSMLRAIGAQIEKTTNREACRDLSGRRLRDINEEKRLKTWIAQEVEREKEAANRKKKKLEKLCEQPRHEFKDENYDKARSDLSEKVEDAILQGLQSSESKQVVEKRKQPSLNVVKKKKCKLWLDADIDELSSTDNEVSDTESDHLKSKEIVVPCTSSSSSEANNEKIEENSI